MNGFKNSSTFVLIFFLLINFLTFNHSFLYLIIIGSYSAHLYKKLQYRKHLQVLSAEFQSEFIYSPINGTVKEIEDNEGVKSIIIQHQLFQGADLCLPMKGVIGDLAVNFDKYGSFSRMRNDSGTLSFSINDESKKIVMNIFSRVIPLRLLPVIQNGDRGKIGAIFGQMPWLGHVKLTLEGQCKIKLNVGDKVTLGGTPIASWS